MGDVRDIAIDENGVWAGSNGGVLQFDPVNRSISKFTNTDGLTSNDVIAVEIGSDGSIWFALASGLLDRYFPAEDKWVIIKDYEGQVISDLVAFGDSMYVGLDVGLSLYVISRAEVKETYTNLGLSSGQNVEKIGATAVAIDGINIWVATEKGVAQSSLDLPNLQAPANWNQHTTLNGLPSSVINDIVVLDGVPYAATRAGVARLGDGQWQRVGEFNDDILQVATVEQDPFFNMNTIVALRSKNVYWLNRSSDQWQLLGQSSGDVTAVGTIGSRVWIGRRNTGIATFLSDSNDWELFSDNSPSSNNFTSLALDTKGRLWCATQDGGINTFNGQAWRNFSTAEGLRSRDQRTVLVDAVGRVWAGSWGGGITIFEEEDEGFGISKIDTSDGLLAGFIGDPNFVLVNALDLDSDGNVWALNREAITNNVLVVNSADNRWLRYSTNEGLNTPFVLSIEADRSGRIWIGTEGFGIKLLDHNRTLENKADDDFTQGLNTSEGLFSNRINALAEDEDGTMWIGTDQGLNFWFGGQVGNRFGLINDFVNTIGIDARNNKWFGTANGVSILDRDGVTWTHFTTATSPLVSGNVTAFAFNDETGEVWIGTNIGLSRLQTPFVSPKENLNLLTGYPNPFIIGQETEFFIITNLAVDTNINIYDVSGRRVRSFDAFNDEEVQGGLVLWDGRNDNGEYVASGIYVYLAFTDGGIAASGKVAVIRP